MIGRDSSTSIRNETPIGTAISRGAGLFANEIQKARDNMETEYGSYIKELNLSLASMSDGSALGAYGGGTVYMNKKYASNSMMTEAMKEAEKSGFHPKLGGKSGTEAITAHEIGHHLGASAAKKANITQKDIVARAAKTLGVKTDKVAAKISTYARYNYEETIAEASCDVYCNGKNASKASQAIMTEIRNILRG